MTTFIIGLVVGLLGGVLIHEITLYQDRSWFEGYEQCARDVTKALKEIMKDLPENEEEIEDDEG